MAWGPEFKSHRTIGEFENVNIYPVVADILGLKIRQSVDGKLKVLKQIIK